MVPAWLMPRSLPDFARVQLSGRALACTALVTCQLRAVAHLDGQAGERTVRQLRDATGCKAGQIGSALAKLQERGDVVPTSKVFGRGYRWTGPR